MSHDAANVVAGWLEKAEDDLRTVHILLADARPPLAVVCFHAQQAAEKLLKALLSRHGIPSPRTHDLAHLVRLLPDGVRPDVPPDVWLELTYYAVAARYPDDLADYTLTLARDLRDKALMVERAVRTKLGSPTEDS